MSVLFGVKGLKVIEQSNLYGDFASLQGRLEQVSSLAQVLHLGHQFICFCPEIPRLVAFVLQRKVVLHWFRLLRLRAEDGAELFADNLSKFLEHCLSFLLRVRVRPDDEAFLLLDAVHLGLQLFCYLFEFEVHFLTNSLTNRVFTLAKSSLMLGKWALMNSELCWMVWKVGPPASRTSISSGKYLLAS